MIRILSAHTREIDDVEISVAEILEQLDLGEHLLRNSVGILAFPPEFLETDVVKAIGAALPFDSIGGTTSNAAVAGAMGGLGEPMLAVTVLTSDEVVFRAGASGAIGDDPQAPIRELYARIAPLPTEKPSLLFMLAPVMDSVGGDDLIEALDAVSGGAPLFGALVSSHLVDLGGATCWNEFRYSDALVLIALFGDVRPEFAMSLIPDDRVIRQNSVITRAAGNQIQEINGLVPTHYLEAIGLAKNGNVIGMSSIPFILTLNDGSRAVRSVYKTTEEGYVLSFGMTPQGARIGFSDCSGDFVLRSARETAARIAAPSGARSALIFSCNARQWSVGANTDAEIKEVAKGLDDSLAYQFAYSVGEICPVRNQDGRLVNRFHNFSIIACLL
jgi:small ligand-binding sensory domain FIST